MRDAAALCPRFRYDFSSRPAWRCPIRAGRVHSIEASVADSGPPQESCTQSTSLGSLYRRILLGVCKPQKGGVASDSGATSQTQTQSAFSSHKFRAAYKKRRLGTKNTRLQESTAFF